MTETVDNTAISRMMSRLLAIVAMVPLLLGAGLAAAGQGKAAGSETKNGGMGDGCSYEVEYHANGKVKSRVGFTAGADGQPVLGCKTTVYFENGKMAMEQEFRNGLPDGVYRTFYESGQVEMEYWYDNGTPEGKVTSWHENGRLKAQGSMKGGLRDGPWATWHEDGNIESQGEYAMDQKIGVWFYQKADGVTTKTVDYSVGTETQ